MLVEMERCVIMEETLWRRSLGRAGEYGECEIMRRVLFVDGCVRGEQSRTLALAKGFLEELVKRSGEWQVETADLNAMGIRPLNEETLREREAGAGAFEGAMFEPAKQFRDADLIVFAAPFWEGTFPAAVHTYLEHICVTGLTFSMGGGGYEGLCRGKRAVLITTRGGIYETGAAVADDHAYGYLKTILTMLGIEKLSLAAAEGLDIQGADVEGLLLKAREGLARLAEEICGDWEPAGGND